jgi:hypothetical protein
MSWSLTLPQPQLSRGGRLPFVAPSPCPRHVLESPRPPTMADADAETAPTAAASAAAPRIHTKAINASWQFDDFFLLSGPEQFTLKRSMAAYLDIRITDCINGSKPMAHEVAGVKPYDPDTVKEAFATYHAYKKDAGTITDAERAQKMDAMKSTTLTISGSACRPKPSCFQEGPQH